MTHEIDKSKISAVLRHQGCGRGFMHVCRIHFPSISWFYSFVLLHFQALYSGDILASKYKVISDSLLLFASSPPSSSVHGDSPGNNTGVGCHALLQEIFQTQGSNQHLFCLFCWKMSSLLLALPGKSNPLAWNVFFSAGSMSQVHP